MAIAGGNCYHFGFLTPKIMNTKKEKIVKEKLPTAKELFDKMLSENVEVTSTEMMIAFAKLHVSEAIEKASKGFKNPDNIRYVKKCYPLDGIV